MYCACTYTYGGQRIIGKSLFFPLCGSHILNSGCHQLLTFTFIKNKMVAYLQQISLSLLIKSIISETRSMKLLQARMIDLLVLMYPESNKHPLTFLSKI